jgi:hypothetical protein
MKLHKMAALAFALTVGASTLALGQENGGHRPPPPPGGPGLLMRKDVQAELKLTAEEIDQIKLVLPPRRGPGREQGGGEGGPGHDNGAPPPPPGGGNGEAGMPPPGDGPGGMQGGPGGPGGPGGRPDGRMIEQKLKKILTVSQFARYKQLALQKQGVGAVGRPEIAAKLGVSDDTLDQIHEIIHGMMDEAHKLMQSGMDPKTAMAQVHAAGDPKILALLDAEQRSKWNEMLGTPFHFSD